MGSIYKDNNGNTTVTGSVCEGGDYLIYLPVDELTKQCSAIFNDAAQSHSSGKLTMWGNSTIEDDTTEFDFASHEEWSNTDGCGAGVPCTSTGNQSAELSDFTISTVEGPTIIVSPDSDQWWGDGQNITLGDPDSTTDKFKGTAFADITVHNGGILTFAPQVNDHIYRINRLNVYGSGITRLNAGVYALGGLGITDGNGRIEVLGEGTVYLFVNKIDSIQGSIIKQSDSARVVIVTKDTLSVNDNAQIDADIYSKFNLQLNGSAYIRGRVAVENLTMNGNAKIQNNLQCGAPSASDYAFNISSAPDALTCEPHPVAIEVWLDGHPVSDYVGTINLATSTNKGVWNKINADGTLTDLGSADNGQASYQFVASDRGVIELGLFNNSASELTVTLSSGAVSAVSDLISFRPYQLKSELSCINQLDSACINIANRPFDLKLTAVGKDPSTDACQVIEEYTGDKQLKFWSSYVPPEVPVGLNVEVNQTAIEKSATNATAQSVAFLNGVATVAVNYPDAGKIQIHARDDQGIGAPPSVIGDELQGSTIAIVNPYKLVINNVTKQQRNVDPDRVVSSAGFIRASVPDYSNLTVDTFDVTVQAVKDCSDSTTSTHCTDTSYGSRTPSFANDITLEPSLVFPVSASAAQGTVHSENGLMQKMEISGEGEMTYSDLSFDEVGTLGVAATSLNYLGITGNHITSAKDAAGDYILTEIGRFYPDYLAYGSYSVTPACNGDFTYLSQQASRFNYTLQAYAQSATAKVTTNYDDSLGYPVAPSADFFDYAYDARSPAAAELTPRLLANDYYQPSGWVRGVYTVSELFGINKAISADGPYFSADNAANYFIQLSGYDGEKVQTDSGNACPDNRCLIGSLGDLVDGRLQAGNGHGSEYQPLRTTVRATYYDGDNFVPFTRDICTTVALSQVQKETITGDITAKTAITISNTPLINGESYFDFSAPQERGKLNYFIDLHTVAPWLLDSGNAVECAGASAGVKECIKGFVEFGLFRGNDRIIYRLQTFNE